MQRFIAPVGKSLGTAVLRCDSALCRVCCSRQSATPLHHVQTGMFSTTLPLMKFTRRRGRGRAREPREGDWTCQCGEVNSRYKRECYKCNAPAPPLPPGVSRPKLPGEDPNDWACPCGQMNFRGNVFCHKCRQPKPEAPPPAGGEITMWNCCKCRGVNRSTRKFCFKCGAPQSLSVR